MRHSACMCLVFDPIFPIIKLGPTALHASSRAIVVFNATGMRGRGEGGAEEHLQDTCNDRSALGTSSQLSWCSCHPKIRSGSTSRVLDGRTNAESQERVLPGECAECDDWSTPSSSFPLLERSAARKARNPRDVGETKEGSRATTSGDGPRRPLLLTCSVAPPSLRSWGDGKAAPQCRELAMASKSEQVPPCTSRRRTSRSNLLAETTCFDGRG